MSRNSIFGLSRRFVYTQFSNRIVCFVYSLHCLSFQVMCGGLLCVEIQFCTRWLPKKFELIPSDFTKSFQLCRVELLGRLHLLHMCIYELIFASTMSHSKRILNIRAYIVLKILGLKRGLLILLCHSHISSVLNRLFFVPFVNKWGLR